MKAVKVAQLVCILLLSGAVDTLAASQSDRWRLKIQLNGGAFQTTGVIRTKYTDGSYSPAYSVTYFINLPQPYSDGVVKVERSKRGLFGTWGSWQVVGFCYLPGYESTHSRLSLEVVGSNPSPTEKVLFTGEADYEGYSDYPQPSCGAVTVHNQDTGSSWEWTREQLESGRTRTLNQGHHRLAMDFKVMLIDGIQVYLRNNGKILVDLWIDTEDPYFSSVNLCGYNMKTRYGKVIPVEDRVFYLPYINVPVTLCLMDNMTQWPLEEVVALVTHHGVTDATTLGKNVGFGTTFHATVPLSEGELNRVCLDARERSGRTCQPPPVFTIEPDINIPIVTITGGGIVSTSYFSVYGKAEQDARISILCGTVTLSGDISCDYNLLEKPQTWFSQPTADVQGEWTIMLPLTGKNGLTKILGVDGIEELPDELQVVAVALDRASNRGISEQQIIQIDTSYPEIFISNPSYSKDMIIYTSSDSVAIKGYAVDIDSGVIRVWYVTGDSLEPEILYDGEPLQEVDFSFSLDLRVLSEDERLLLAFHCIDESGWPEQRAVSVCFVRDTVPPEIPNLLYPPEINGDRVILRGNGESGTTVEVIEVDTVKVAGSAPVYDDGLGGGTWVAKIDNLRCGTHYFYLAARDNANNTSVNESPMENGPIVVTIKSGLPAVPVITKPRQGDIVEDTWYPEIICNAFMGTQVEIFYDNVLTGVADCSDTGEFSFTPEYPLEEGDHYLSARTVNKSGARSALEDFQPVYWKLRVREFVGKQNLHLECPQKVREYSTFSVQVKTINSDASVPASRVWFLGKWYDTDTDGRVIDNNGNPGIHIDSLSQVSNEQRGPAFWRNGGNPGRLATIYAEYDDNGVLFSCDMDVEILPQAKWLVFSPNSDGINDEIRWDNCDYPVVILDWSGRKVVELTQAGTWLGNNEMGLESGIYVYRTGQNEYGTIMVGR